MSLASVLRSTAQLKAALPSLGGREGIVTPFQFVFTGEDHLRVRCLNVVAGARVAVQWRFMSSDNTEIQSNTTTFLPTSDGLESHSDIQIGPGVILNLVVRVFDARVVPGQCYVAVDVVRGDNAGTVLGTMLAGYVGSYGGRAWPGTPLQNPLEGPGCVQVITGTVPAAGLSPVIVQPAATQWRIISAIASLQTDATAGNREVFLQASTGPRAIWQSHSSYAQPPSSSGVHTFAGGLANIAPGGSILGQGSLPTDCLLRSPDTSVWTLLVGAFGLSLGDQFSSLALLVEEWRSATEFPVVS